MKVLSRECNESPIMQAIIELDQKLFSMGYKPFDLNVVGGFALIVRGIRKNIRQVTDVDYIGPVFSNEVKSIANNIGVQNGIGRNWINNDLMLTGTTLEDIEFSTGKLHFTEGIKLSVIRLMILSEVDLLRMKLISIDTNLAAIEFGGNYTRMKDLEDIIRLKNHLRYDYIKMEDIAGDYLISDYVFDLISAYEMGSYEGAFSFIKEIYPNQEDIEGNNANNERDL